MLMPDSIELVLKSDRALSSISRVKVRGLDYVPCCLAKNPCTPLPLSMLPNTVLRAVSTSPPAASLDRYTKQSVSIPGSGKRKTKSMMDVIRFRFPLFFPLNVVDGCL